jgi:hypothetical protein
MIFRRPAFAIAAALLASASFARAEFRGTIYPGSICRNSGGGKGAYTSAGIVNVSPTDTLHLACPIPLSVRDANVPGAFLAASGGPGCPNEDGNGVLVLVNGINPTANITCTVYVLGAGNVVTASFGSTPVGAGGHTIFLAFNIPRMDITGKTLYADCTVPPLNAQSQASSITSFNIDSCDP